MLLAGREDLILLHGGQPGIFLFGGQPSPDVSFLFIQRQDLSDFFIKRRAHFRQTLAYILMYGAFGYSEPGGSGPYSCLIFQNIFSKNDRPVIRLLFHVLHSHVIDVGTYICSRAAVHDFPQKNPHILRYGDLLWILVTSSVPFQPSFSENEGNKR